MAGILLWVWGAYSFPRNYPPPIDAHPLLVALVLPAYVAFGDEADLEVTVTNGGTDPTTGAVTVSFSGGAAAHPLPAETTTVKLEGLAGGASLTQRLKFSLAQAPTFWSQEVVHLALHVAVGDQHMRLPVEPQIRLAPVPYLNTISSLLFGSSLVATVSAFFWDIFKKRILGMEAG